jgi:hypothetical protein
VDEIRESGLRLAVVGTTGAKVVRVRFFRHHSNSTTTAVRRKHVLTRYHRAKAKRTVIELGKSKQRKLRPGRYTIELKAGKSRSTLGRAATRRITITR